MDASQIESGVGYFTSESDLGTIPTLSSNQISSAARQGGSMNINSEDYLEAFRYKTHGKLRHAHTQGVVAVANQYTTIRQEQEEHYLRTQVGSPQHNLSAQVALDIARLARNTLTAKADLAQTKIKECEILLINLQDAFEDASFCAAEADRQVHHLLNHLDPNKLSSSSIEFEYPQHSPLSPATLAAYKEHIQTFLPVNWHAGYNDLTALNSLSGNNSVVAPEGSEALEKDSISSAKTWPLVCR
ncbi:hypothetical protein GALMADRAFT_235268 [Galerina marginata CBS 339.88]|uniref:Uncharacterized protein n=1 Tax=Galerina marginata (strain CBS 339.88) TaxID=685588 RepID=A0A067TUP8_GALM3|nr:hypothetical protein GALMADRAFT_235268 [Galerina marginata CBS 339.88]